MDGEMAQKLRVLAAFAEGSDLVPSTYVRQLLPECNSSFREIWHFLLASRVTCTHVHIPTHKYTQIIKNKSQNKREIAF